jgi:GNAT superfamily N-acetyltransferase
MTIERSLSGRYKAIQTVRNPVTENTLSDPSLITDNNCDDFISKRGKGWVCEIDSNIVGFSVVDMQYNNVWALFEHPAFEKRGIGRRLHDMMLDWYFSQTSSKVWLGTSPNTRAEMEDPVGLKLELMEKTKSNSK